MIESPDLGASIARQATRLERFHARVEACRVALQRWSQHHGQGASYHIAIGRTLPDEELAVARESEVDGSQQALEAKRGSEPHSIEALNL